MALIVAACMAAAFASDRAGGEEVRLALQAGPSEQPVRAGAEDVASRQLRQRREGHEHQAGCASQGRLLLRLPDGLRPGHAERQPEEGPGDQLDRAVPGGALLAVLQGLRARLPPADDPGDRQAEHPAARHQRRLQQRPGRLEVLPQEVQRRPRLRPDRALAGQLHPPQADRRSDRQEQGASQAHALRDPPRRQRQRRPGVRRQLQARSARRLQEHRSVQDVDPAPLRDGLLDLQRAGPDGLAVRADDVPRDTRCCAPTRPHSAAVRPR